MDDDYEDPKMASFLGFMAGVVLGILVLFALRWCAA